MAFFLRVSVAIFFVSHVHPPLENVSCYIETCSIPGNLRNSIVTDTIISLLHGKPVNARRTRLNPVSITFIFTPRILQNVQLNCSAT